MRRRNRPTQARQRRLPLYQPDREKQVLGNAERANPGPLPDAAIRRLFERILDEARSVETRGPAGTPGHAKKIDRDQFVAAIHRAAR